MHELLEGHDLDVTGENVFPGGDEPAIVSSGAACRGQVAPEEHVMVGIVHRPRSGPRRSSGRVAPWRRTVDVLVALCLVLLGVSVGPTPHATADGNRGRPHPGVHDHLRATGFDLDSDLRSDVVAGSSGNNLDLVFVAGRPLVDGTVVVTLPRRDWRTPLHPAGQLYEGDPQLPGSVVVRPVAPFTEDDCRGTGDQPISVSVVTTTTARLGIVRHLTCASGQHTSLRVVDVEAPRKAGAYTIPVRVSDASGPRSHHQVRVRVVERPTTRLKVSLPDQVLVQAPVLVLVEAVRPDGRTDTRYRGWVRLVGPAGDDCLFESGAPVRFRLRARDAGVLAVPVRFQLVGAQQLVAEGISHRTRAGQRASFTVLGDPPPPVCSVSYH